MQLRGFHPHGEAVNIYMQTEHARFGDHVVTIADLRPPPPTRAGASGPAAGVPSGFQQW